MGIQGAAIASSGSYMIFTALILTALRRELRVKWREFFVPSFSELAHYGKLAARCKAMLWAPAVSPDSNVN
jgi:Na+-driven multidrug efflux pump